MRPATSIPGTFRELAAVANSYNCSPTILLDPADAIDSMRFVSSGTRDACRDRHSCGRQQWSIALTATPAGRGGVIVPKRAFLLIAFATAWILLLAAKAAAGPIISVNPADFIPAPPPYAGSTVFVVPVEISGAVNLTSWQFSLMFNPADVQINTACDSTTDPFCDPIFGPVTQGPFFLNTAQFPPFFDPGFVFNNTGLLDSVAGAWQDPPPGPSGNGILAYVEFITTGTGTGESPITVTGASTT